MTQDIKIVTEHYPAEKLPEELRGGIDPDAEVRVTIEVATSPTRDIPSLMSFLGAGKGVYSEEEAVSYIRSLRDE